MGLRISTNMPAIAAQKVLQSNAKRLEHASQALATGSRIVHASDDAAGLAIAENLKAQTRGIAQAKNNAFNAGSLIQVSEGGLNEINNILVRVRELGIQGASDTVGDKERGFINEESKQLLQEADRIAKTTRFGDKKLLDGSGGDQEFQVGPYGGQDNIIKFSLESNATASELGIDGIDLSDKSSARDALETVDEALGKIGTMRANFGAIQSRLDSTVSNLDTQYENVSEAHSRISDTDVAKETSEMASANILQNAAVSVLAQANQFPQVALKLIS